MSATSMLRPTWLGRLGSTNVVMVLATAAKTSLRSGDDSGQAVSGNLMPVLAWQR
jgi:hypothetical protein